MKTALFSGWRTKAAVEDTRLDAGDITVHVIPANNQITVAVAGRVTVDSSPNLRSVTTRRTASQVQLQSSSSTSPACPIWICPASQPFWKH